MYVFMYVCMDICMYGCMYGCMVHVCLCVLLHVCNSTCMACTLLMLIWIRHMRAFTVCFLYAWAECHFYNLWHLDAIALLCYAWVFAFPPWLYIIHGLSLRSHPALPTFMLLYIINRDTDIVDVCGFAKPILLSYFRIQIKITSLDVWQCSYCLQPSWTHWAFNLLRIFISLVFTLLYSGIKTQA